MGPGIFQGFDKGKPSSIPGLDHGGAGLFQGFIRAGPGLFQGFDKGGSRSIPRS